MSTISTGRNHTIKLSQRDLTALAILMGSGELDQTKDVVLRFSDHRVADEERVPHLPAPDPDQVPWLEVDEVGGRCFAIWRRTLDVYLVGGDGAVMEEPLVRGGPQGRDPIEVKL